MSYDVRVIAINEFLRTDVSGVVNLEASRELLRTLVSAASTRGVDRVLLDARDARAAVSTADIWNLANDLGALGVSRLHRLAFLLKPPQDDFDRGAFLELCATNRGYKIRAFHEFENAFTWLTADE
jgi:hypothetical protein